MAKLLALSDITYVSGTRVGLGNLKYIPGAAEE